MPANLKPKCTVEVRSQHENFLLKYGLDLQMSELQRWINGSLQCEESTDTELRTWMVEYNECKDLRARLDTMLF